MAKNTILKERGTGEDLYPHTLADLVQTSAGKNVSEELTTVNGKISTLNGEIEAAKKQAFIDMWNAACDTTHYDYPNHAKVGKYNAETGYFELNGITDITYEEALKIYQISCPIYSVDLHKYEGFALNTDSWPRTLIPQRMPHYSPSPSYDFIGTYKSCGCLEVIHLPVGMSYGFKNGIDEEIKYYPTVKATNFEVTFSNCQHLREVIGVIWLGDIPEYPTTIITPPTGGRANFTFCVALTTIYIYNLNVNLNFKDSPKLSLASLKFMINGRHNTDRAISLNVHPDVYHKITGNTDKDVYNNLTEEEKAAWTSLLTEAQAKKVTFTSYH